MSTVEILIAARKLIEKPETWIQETYNRSASGQPWVDEKYAACWCAEGALFHFYTESDDHLQGAMAAISEAIGCAHIPTWNDAPERTHAEVLEAFDRAIELARQSSK